MLDFDFHKNCWYIPVKSKEESLAAIEFLKTKGYEFQIDGAFLFIENFKHLTNTYSGTNVPHDYLLYGTNGADVSDLPKINLKFGLAVVDYEVDFSEITRKKISDLEGTVKILNEKIAELKKEIRDAD